MTEKKVRVLELFSGIGGMHFSLCKSKSLLNKLNEHGFKKMDFDVVSALDISELANKVYRHNFPQVAQLNGNICGLKQTTLESLEVDAIFMSPPCQPFTRQGLKKDLQDNRSEPLTHLITQIIPKMTRLKYILVENVKGFETSEAHQMLVTMLKESGYNIQEFLINPTTLGIPNSRLRYYLIAKKKSENFEFETRSEFETDFDFIEPNLLSILREELKIGDKKCLKEYLQKLSQDEAEAFRLNDKTLKKYARILDIVRPDSTSSCCFTKAYSKYAEGTGSIIQEIGDFEYLNQIYKSAEELKADFEKASNENASNVDGTVSNCDGTVSNFDGTVSNFDLKVQNTDGTVSNPSFVDTKVKEELMNKYVNTLKQLGLRYFTPIEIAGLLGFPVSEIDEKKFEFPPAITAKYRLLGNSLSVTTVSLLTTLLFLCKE